MKKRLLPVWALVLIDALITGVLLLGFAYFHHVRPVALEEEGTVIVRATAEPTPQVTELLVSNVTPVPTEVPDEPESTPTPRPVPEGTDAPGSFIRKFADKFTSGEIITSAEDGVYTYQSASLNITVTPATFEYDYYGETRAAKYYFTDFYVSDISCITSVLARDVYGTGNYEWLQDMAKRTGAVLAVNGDFYGARKNGVVIRNGKVYRKNHSSFDACALYWDGSMETFASKDWTADKLIAKGAYQAWSFGPELLDDNGQPLGKYNATNAVLTEQAPRTAIGYFEPGHYCFVTVDGRSNASKGLKMEDLARLMSCLGCKCAYNLDGGESSVLTWGSEVINAAYKGGRKVSDGIMLIDIGGGM